jgi:hypothetical protein
MKNIIIKIMIILPLSLYSASLSHQEITMMVSKIKDERPGVSLEILEKTPNPFAIVEKVIKQEIIKEIKIEKPKEIIPTESYTISAVLNHAAFINKKWYRVGDTIGSYRVISVGKSSANLKRGKKIKKLIIERKKKKFKIFKGN